MKTESNIYPEAYRMERVGDTVEVILTDDVTEREDENGTVYEYDEYRLTVPWREGLENTVADDPAVWLRYAADAEYDKLVAEVREKRDALLAESDWTQCADSPLTEEAREAWREYRQALRDITGQNGFPYTVHWPERPV